MDIFLEDESGILGFFEQENYLGLIDYLQSLSEQNPHDTLLLAYLAIAYFATEETESAEITLLNCLLSCDEKDLENISFSLNKIANIYVNKKQFNFAINVYKQALEFNPNYLEGYLKLGDCLLQSGDFDRCINLWEDTLINQPAWVELSSKLGEQWQIIGEYDKAIECYLNYLNCYPQDINILHNLGICYTKINNIDLAINYQEQCLLLDNNFVLSYGELGYLYLLKGDLRVSEKYLQLLIKNYHHIFFSYLLWLEDKTVNHFNYVQVLFNKNLISDLLFSESLSELSSQYIKNIHINSFVNNDDISYKKDHKTINNIELVQNQVQGYYQKAKDWVQTSNLTNCYWEIYDDSQINLKPPHTDKKRIHHSFYFPSNITLPSSFVAFIEKGIFWLRKDEGSSAIITPDNHFIGDISPESPALSPNHPDKHPRYHSLLKTSHLPKINHLNGRVVVLAGLLNNIYFHWLFDILPRINLLEKMSFDWNTVDSFLVDNRCDFQRETLDIFGIPSDKIIPISFPTCIQADNLIVPSFPSAIAWMPLWSCHYLRQKILGDSLNKEKPHKRIYISRAKSSNRRLINELEITEILKQYNFEIINLELLSVKQQAKLLNQAEIVISPHGSGLSNIVFCQPQTKIVEIFSPFYVYPCYWLVSNHLNLEYYYVLGEIFGTESFHKLLYPDSRLEEIYLNPHSLKKILCEYLKLP